MFHGELAKVHAELEPWEKQLIEHNGKLEVTSTKRKFLNKKHEVGRAAYDDAQKKMSDIQPVWRMGRIAAILSLEVEDQNASLDALHRVGSKLAMHVVASKPLFLSKDLVSSDAIEKEHEILKSQL
ncbi:unnamed protein product [Ilex paraguariensis]|uniref:Translation elongation factor EFTs/EF1B dimerisation domain-containing protein n=1 Tax=Ilex paraguariensis TaxID=185542 RepID=A0ABC8V055_9AQUA